MTPHFRRSSEALSSFHHTFEKSFETKRDFGPASTKRVAEIWSPTLLNVALFGEEHHTLLIRGNAYLRQGAGESM